MAGAVGVSLSVGVEGGAETEAGLCVGMGGLSRDEEEKDVDFKGE